MLRPPRRPARPGGVSVSERWPILDYPGRGRAVIEPGPLLEHKRRVPAGCVLCFFREVLRERQRDGELAPLLRLRSEAEPIQVYRLGSGRRALTVAFPGVGAPFAAAVLEELIALGARRFIVCGGAGVLDGGIAPGSWIVPAAALRDEGTSYHYLPPRRTVRPDRGARRALLAACRGRGGEPLGGMSWTTDAVYRETAAKVRRRRSEGCLTVEMEAAALFAVARFRRVALAQILYAGDDVSGSEWDDRDWARLRRVRRELFALAVTACRRLDRSSQGNSRAKG